MPRVGPLNRRSLWVLYGSFQMGVICARPLDSCVCDFLHSLWGGSWNGGSGDTEPHGTRGRIAAKMVQMMQTQLEWKLGMTDAGIGGCSVLARQRKNLLIGGLVLVLQLLNFIQSHLFCVKERITLRPRKASSKRCKIQLTI